MQHTFLDFLVSGELISSFVADNINSYAKENRLGIIASLFKFCDLSESRIAREVAKYYNLPLFDYNFFEVDQVATELVSGIVSVRLGILPYRFGPSGELYVVCSDPDLISGMLQELEKLIAGGLYLEIGSLSAVRELAAFVHYGRSFSRDFSVAADDSDPLDLPLSSRSDFVEDVAASHGFDEDPYSGRFDHPIPDELEVDRKLARLATLNQSSEPLLWDDEDTVVKRGIARDESLKDFFLRNITARHDPPELDEQRRQLMYAERSKRGESRTASGRHNLPSPQEIAQNYDRREGSRTPTLVDNGEPEESSLLVELVRHSSRIEQLEEQVSLLRGEVEHLGRLTQRALKCLTSAGFHIGLDDDSSCAST